MPKNLDIITAAVSLIMKAAILAGQWSGRARRRGLEKLAATDADAKDREKPIELIEATYAEADTLPEDRE